MNSAHKKRNYARRHKRAEFVSEGKFHFIRSKRPVSNNYRKRGFWDRNRSLRKRTSRILSTLLKVVVASLIIGLLVWAGGNFVIQTFFPSSVDTGDIEDDIFRLINEERANRGFPTLKEDTLLTTISSEWSQNLAETGELTHGDFSSRIASIGYAQYSCGEIIAEYGGMSLWTPSLGREFVDMWLNSPKHYEIMITNSNGFMGVGVSKGRAGFFAVVDFRFS